MMAAVRVLVVDDEPSIRMTCSMLLRMEGYDVEVAEDGQAALRTALLRPPDIVLSDVHMPHLDGHALLAAVRQAPTLRHARVVLLAVPSERVAAATQPDAWLAKPFRRDELLAVLRG